MILAPAKRRTLSVKMAGVRGRAPTFMHGEKRRAPLPLLLIVPRPFPTPSTIPKLQLSFNSLKP